MGGVPVRALGKRGGLGLRSEQRLRGCICSRPAPIPGSTLGGARLGTHPRAGPRTLGSCPQSGSPSLIRIIRPKAIVVREGCDNDGLMGHDFISLCAERINPKEELQ